MQDSKFRRIAAVLMIGSVLYVGHGLHNGGNDGAPSLLNTAQAGGVALSTAKTPQYVYTASADGKLLYLWQTGTDGKPRYVGAAKADDGGGRTTTRPLFSN
jgi:hypothetical protein